MMIERGGFTLDEIVRKLKRGKGKASRQEIWRWRHGDDKPSKEQLRAILLIFDRYVCDGLPGNILDLDDKAIVEILSLGRPRDLKRWPKADGRSARPGVREWLRRLRMTDGFIVLDDDRVRPKRLVYRLFADDPENSRTQTPGMIRIVMFDGVEDGQAKFTMYARPLRDWLATKVPVRDE